MRISDWSSDVCSSDLSHVQRRCGRHADCHCAVLGAHSGGGAKCYRVLDKPMTKMSDLRDELAGEVETILSDAFTICTTNTAVAPHSDRSEERRGGKECVSTGRSRWSPYT